MGKLATADAKAEAMRAMRQAAEDMGITASELADMLAVERELAAMQADNSRADDRDESNPRKVLARADRTAEAYGTWKGSPEARERAREAREAVKNDRARVASRKIARALPLTADAVVVTHVGWEVVELRKVQKADNPEAIARRLSSATAREAKALANRAEAEAIAEARTVMGRVPKAEAEALEIAKVRADREIARVAKLRKQLALATGAKVADGLTSFPVGEVRVSLNPQSMANRVAKLATELPTRKDVHPFRYELRERHIPRVPYGKPYGGEAEVLRAEAEAEAEAIRAEARKQANARAREAWEARQRELEAEAEARKQETRTAYLAREAMRKREARRAAKKR